MAGVEPLMRAWNMILKEVYDTYAEGSAEVAGARSVKYQKLTMISGADFKKYLIAPHPLSRT
jgi:hypothetical protein